MYKTLALPKSKGITYAFLTVLLGSGLLALASQVSIPIPFTPIPMSLQSLAVFFLAATLGGKRAFLSVMLYLIEGSFGLPVFAMAKINPLWFIGPSAGYLIGFAFTAFFLGIFLEKKSQLSFLSLISLLTLADGLIIASGSLWLALFFGLEHGFQLGSLPFILIEGAKITFAASCMICFRTIKKYLSA